MHDSPDSQARDYHTSVCTMLFLWYLMPSTNSLMFSGCCLAIFCSITSIVMNVPVLPTPALDQKIILNLNIHFNWLNIKTKLNLWLKYQIFYYITFYLQWTSKGTLWCSEILFLMIRVNLSIDWGLVGTPKSGHWVKAKWRIVRLSLLIIVFAVECFCTKNLFQYYPHRLIPYLWYF